MTTEAEVLESLQKLASYEFILGAFKQVRTITVEASNYIGVVEERPPRSRGLRTWDLLVYCVRSNVLNIPLVNMEVAGQING